MEKFWTIVNDKDRLSLLQWLEDNTTIKWAGGDLPTNGPRLSTFLGFHEGHNSLTHNWESYGPQNNADLVPQEEFKYRIQKLFPKEEITGPIAVKIEGNKYKEILEWLENNTNIRWRAHKELPTGYQITSDCVSLNIDSAASNSGLSYCSSQILSKVVDLQTFKEEAMRRYPKVTEEKVLPEKTSQQEPIHPKEEYLGIWDCPTGICCIEWNEGEEKYVYKVPQSEQMWEEYLDPMVVEGHIRDGWFTRPKPYKPGDYRNKILSRPKAKSYLSQGKSGWSSY